MLRVYVANKVERAHLEHDSGPLEFGRGPRREAPRLTVRDPQVSNHQLRMVEQANGQLQVENLSQRVTVKVSDGTSLPPGAVRALALPLRLSVGETLVEIECVRRDAALESLSLRTVEPPVQTSRMPRLATLASLSDTPSPEKLAQWLETVIAVQRSAASSPEFYEQTARAVVDLIGLDCGLVILRDGHGEDDWTIVARASSGAALTPTDYSRAILRRVSQEQRTFYQTFNEQAMTASLVDVSAVVAAPIMSDKDDRVMGVVYGSRSLVSERASVAIRPLEAQLIQLLAAAVGAGLARLTSETEAARRFVQFEQFFSADLARELDRDPSLLEGRIREVTVLFADIRGFSRVSERLSPRETCLMVGDVMERLTARIREHGGAIVDYVGDGLLAMWNAPVEQTGHPILACHAALAMLDELPGLNARWRDRLNSPVGVGIGLNTGPALVGNTGSRLKFKYGPHGHTVNLGSRVEGATKHLGVPILITGATHELLGDTFATRRLCRVRVAGINAAVDLYELAADHIDPDWAVQRDIYETGLALFEAGRWAEACRIWYPLLADQEGRYDRPTLSLVGRAIECLKDPPAAFDPVLELTTK